MASMGQFQLNTRVPLLIASMAGRSWMPLVDAKKLAFWGSLCLIWKGQQSGPRWRRRPKIETKDTRQTDMDEKKKIRKIWRRNIIHHVGAGELCFMRKCPWRGLSLWCCECMVRLALFVDFAANAAPRSRE